MWIVNALFGHVTLLTFSSSKKIKKCDVELTVWGYGGRLGEQNCEYDKKSLWVCECGASNPSIIENYEKCEHYKIILKCKILTM